jgi:hypothetical protein
MTIKEFERWFALQVGIYHGTIHRALGVPPMTRGATTRQSALRHLGCRLPYSTGPRNDGLVPAPVTSLLAAHRRAIFPVERFGWARCRLGGVLHGRQL